MNSESVPVRVIRGMDLDRKWVLAIRRRTDSPPYLGMDWQRIGRCLGKDMKGTKGGLVSVSRHSREAVIAGVGV